MNILISQFYSLTLIQEFFISPSFFFFFLFEKFFLNKSGKFNIYMFPNRVNIVVSPYRLPKMVKIDQNKYKEGQPSSLKETSIEVRGRRSGRVTHSVFYNRYTALSPFN